MIINGAGGCGQWQLSGDQWHLHSLNEAREQLQWLCHDENTISIG